MAYENLLPQFHHIFISNRALNPLRQYLRHVTSYERENGEGRRRRLVGGPRRRFKGTFPRRGCQVHTWVTLFCLGKLASYLTPCLNRSVLPQEPETRAEQPRCSPSFSLVLFSTPPSPSWNLRQHPLVGTPDLQPPSNGETLRQLRLHIVPERERKRPAAELPALRKDSTRVPFKFSRNSFRCARGLQASASGSAEGVFLAGLIELRSISGYAVRN